MVIMIIVNMKMSKKTSIAIIIIIVYNVTCIIIIIIIGNSAHISLISAGISLSRGKVRMDIKVVLQTQTRPLFRRQ